jgi:diacylglycerol kinase
MKASELIARVELVCGELRADQKADVVKAAKDIGATAVLDVLDEVRAYKNWVVFKSYLDRKRTEVMGTMTKRIED